MELLLSLFADLGKLIRPYNGDLALALVASFLVITGGDINNFIKRQISSANFVFRTLVFVVVCTFGYGAVTVFLTSLLKAQLAKLSAAYLAITVISAFIALGIFAERKRQI